MGLLSKLFGLRQVKKRDAKIVLLGPSGSGKTTLVRYLETGIPVETDPRTTLGIDIRKTPVKVAGWQFRAIDVGGQDLFQRTFWSLAVDQADAVIFLIDGTVKPSEDSDVVEQAIFQFDYMLTLIDNVQPLLILVNKQDLSHLHPLTTKEAVNLYSITQITDRPYNVVPTSAKYGNGVEVAMRWLVEVLDSSL